MLQGPPRRRRARPVADAPIDGLLLRADDVAKGWLLALVEQNPLEDAPAILATELTRDGPRLCAAALQALADDSALRCLEPGGALQPLTSRIGDMAGAGGLEKVSQAVDTLSAILWSALRGELRDPDAELVSELAERLALVIELVRGAALRRFAVRSKSVGRAAAPHALWVEALEDAIADAERTGTALALVLVELEDADRVAAAEAPGEVAATFERFASAIRSALRVQDILACESDVRMWVIARETGRHGAHALAARMLDAASSASWRGAPLRLSVGFAVLGEEGRDSDELIGAAEEARFAASASGIGVIPIAEGQGTSGYLADRGPGATDLGD